MTTATPEIDFKKISPYQQRSFVVKSAQLLDVNEVTDYYNQLLDRDIRSSEQLKQWILDRSELDAAIDQSGNILYIRMTLQTNDKKRTKVYKQYIETVSPAIKPLVDKLNKKYLHLLEKFSLDNNRYAVYDRQIKADVSLFVQKSVPLETEVVLLSQQYQTVCGAMTVDFEGKERTMPQMSRFLLETDRGLREKAWRAIAQRRLQDKEALDKIFNQMVKLRHQIAQNAGYDNFCDYKFQALHRFDYTPAQCKEYHDSIEKLVVPLWEVILQKRKEALGLDKLRPWDTAVDLLGRKALKPFEKIENLIEGCQAIFDQVDSQFGKQFKEMVDLGVLDLASRKGKAPGGYQSTLNEVRKPFIFMNAVGIDDDVRTLLHEAGHAFHALACAHDGLVDYRHGPMEFNEVASMAMELLAGEYLSVFYNTEEEKRSKIEHFEDIIYVLIWVAIIDAFQHWIYENPNHTGEQRKKAWIHILDRFSPKIVNWEGLEQEREYLWHRQLHIFEVPFYYIEYGIAQLGALQVWLNSKKDWTKALSHYRRGLAVGGSKSLPAIYTEAGIRFDFSAATITPLVTAVKDSLDSLNHG